MDKKNIKKIVRDGYAEIARTESSCCQGSSCCSGGAQAARDISRSVGYSDAEMDAVPGGANLGLGCGNPVAITSLEEGETVLDLGSGAGFDSFLASRRVGPAGRVIGVDMTPEMIEKAVRNAAKGGYKNVEFRLGEIEKLPVEDGCIDAVISNCVINLSPDKESVFREAFRVLKPGGRMMVSDLVLIKELPPEKKESVKAYVGCISGAINKDEYLSLVKKTGFRDVSVEKESGYPADDSVASICVRAVK